MPPTECTGPLVSPYRMRLPPVQRYRSVLRSLGVWYALVLIPPTVGGAGEIRRPVLGLGHEYDLGGREEFLLPDPLVDGSIVPDHPLYVRIRASWAMLEAHPGV